MPPITLSSAIVVSMLISLTTTPMMCSRVLLPDREVKHGRIYNWSERIFQYCGEYSGLPHQPELGARPPGIDPRHFRDYHGVECISADPYSQGISSRCRIPASPCKWGCRALRTLRSTPCGIRRPAGHRHCQSRSWRRQRHGLHGRSRRYEHRLRFHRAETARRAQSECCGHHRAPSSEACAHPRLFGVPTGRSGYSHRRQIFQRGLSIRAGG